MAGSQTRDKLLADVLARVTAAAATPQAVLDPAAVGLVNALLTVAPSTPEDLEILQAVGWFFWARHDLGAQAGQGDEKLALVLLQRPYAADPASVPDEARRALSAADPSDYMLNGHIGSVFLQRALQFRDQGALAEAIRLLRLSVADLPAEDAGSAGYLDNLGLALEQWYRLHRGRAELGEAIDVERRAVRAAGSRHKKLTDMRQRLIRLLEERFSWAPDKDLIDEAIAVRRQVLEATGAGDLTRPAQVCELAKALGARYLLLNDDADIRESLGLARDVRSRAAGTEAAFAAASVLLTGLAIRYGRHGVLADLEESIQIGRAALEEMPEQSPSRAAIVTDLATALRMRYERFGEASDIDDSVELARQATASPVTPSAHAGRLANLASVLSERYEFRHDPADAEDAVRAGEAAVAALPDPKEDAVGARTSLGRALASRYDSGSAPADLTRAIDTFREVLGGTVEGRVGSGAALSNLGNTLHRRAGEQADPALLDQAIEVQEKALAVTPPDDPQRAQRLYNLAVALRSKWLMSRSSPASLRSLRTRTRGIAAASRAVDLLMTASARPLASTHNRLIAALEAGRLASARRDYPVATKAFAAAVALLPQLASRRLSRLDAEGWLAEFAGVASAAAACAELADDSGWALRLFETGRGVLLSRVLDADADITALAAADPERARRFEQLRDELDGPSTEPQENPAGLAERRRSGAAEFDELLSQVRAMPGLERFLAGPTLDELLGAVSDGAAVVVNVSPWACHALLIKDGELRSLRLRQLTADEVGQRSESFLAAARAVHAPQSAAQGTAAQGYMRETLAWLWRAVAAPVLQELGYTRPHRSGEPWPKVWWVASGSMSVFPLGAAGEYGTGEAGCVPERVVSSYVPTIRALLRIRQRAAATPGTGRGLAIAMRHTAGEADLPGTQLEADVLKRRFADCLVLRDGRATFGRVVAGLRSASWAHFACHARSDPQQPSRSALLLHDYQAQPLTVAELSRLRLHQVRFAYLSACSTSATTRYLADEAVHITGACLLAGFRSVIGTLWPVEDEVSVTIADQVYVALSEGGDPDMALALHRAQAPLREEWPLSPSLWASHVHVGA